MKILIIILLVVLSLAGTAQVYTPQTAAGYQYKRLKADSTLQIPSFCGVPNARSLAEPNNAAIAFDSCGHKFYFYDPKTNSWDTLTSFSNITTIINNITIDSIHEGEEHLYFTTERVRGSLYADQPILYDSAFGRFYLDTSSATGVATKHDLIHIDTAVIGVTGYMSGDTSVISIDKNGGGNNKIYLVDPTTGSVNAQSYGTLGAAVLAVGATSRNMIIGSPMALSSNLIVPANISLTILKGGSIYTNGYTLTINGAFEAGRYQVFSGPGVIEFGKSSIDAQFPEWDGAYNDGTHSAEGTNAFRLQYLRNFPISLGIGTYLVDSITTTNGNPLIIFGQKQKASIIQLSATSATGISIGRKISVERSVLKDFTLLGTSSNYCGISLGGDSTTFIYTAFTTLDNLDIQLFTGTDASGIRLNQVQELHVNNCTILNNYDNVLRPNIGYVTSTLFTGKSSYIGRATNRGFAAVGAISDITFRDIIFESNIKEAFYYNFDAIAGNISIEDCYFEQNCTSGTGAISITGGSVAYHQPSIKLSSLDFHTNVNAAIPVLYLQNVFGGEVSKCNGLFASGAMAVGNNVRCHFFNNSSAGSAANLRTYYQGLLSTSIGITADDYDVEGKWFHIGRQDFNDKISIDTAGNLTLASTGTINTSAIKSTAGSMFINYAGGNGATYIGRGGAVLIDSMQNVRMDTSAILSVNQIKGISGAMFLNYAGGNGQTYIGKNGAVFIDSNKNVRMDSAANLAVSQINGLSGSMFLNYIGGNGTTFLGHNGALYIDATGKLGVGTSAPTQALTISGKANYLSNPTMAAADSNTLTNKKYVDSVAALNTTAIALKSNIITPTFTTNITTPLIYGSAASGGTLTLGSTSHATKGKILFGTSAYDEVNNRLGINTISPANTLSVSPLQYATGTASQSGTAVVGVGTTFTVGMVGSQLVYADGTNSGTIFAFTDATHITATTSQTVASQAFKIGYSGLQVDATGNVGIGTAQPGALLDVSNYANAPAQIWITSYRYGVGQGYNWRLGAGSSSTSYAFGIFNGAAATPSFSINSVTNAGNIGIGVTAGSSTALLHIKAGTATATTAPLKFTAGTNLTTPEAGAVEFDGTNYFTTIGTTRYILVRTLTGTAAPATTPAAVGIQFVDTTNKKVYVATGTASSADWTILN